MTDRVEPWKLLSSTIALDEKWFRVRKDTVQLPSGKIVDDYFVWESPHLIGIVPVTADGKFVLVEQYRHAVGQNLLHFPTGALDNNETLGAAARRELEEETGYVCNTVVHLGQFTPYGTKLTGLYDVFIGLGAKPQGEKHHDELEESKVHLMDSAMVWKHLTGGGVLALSMATSFCLATKYLQEHPLS